MMAKEIASTDVRIARDGAQPIPMIPGAAVTVAIHTMTTTNLTAGQQGSYFLVHTRFRANI
jgi:hypothetical protein